MENWKPIEGYEGHYDISNYGRVKGYIYWGYKIRKEPRILNQWPDEKGYLMVNLCKYGKCKTHRVAVLVAKYFIGPRPKGLTINHKDFNKVNNHVSNLEYITNLENLLHGYKHNHNRKTRKGEGVHLAKFTEKEIHNIRKIHSKNNITFTETAKKYNVHPQTIGKIVRRLTWKHI
mgnify:CR=1 FL=1